MTTPGRNDPCPCGSGRKYKHCCLRRAGGATRVLDDVPPPGALHGGWSDPRDPAEPAEFSKRLFPALQEQTFDDMDDARDFIETVAARQNREPAPGFDGLNPEQMQALLYAPHDSPEVLRIARSLEASPRAPILAWFHLIADALGEDGVHATAKGNLPRALSRDAALRAHDDPAYGPQPYPQPPDKVRGEDDVFLLHYTRVAAREAGLLRLHRRRWTLTRRAREALAAGDEAALYLRLFDALTSRIDWRYGTLYHELDMLQNAWPFIIRLLQRYGDEPRTADFYVGALREAFPSFDDEAIAEMKPWRLEYEDPIGTTLRLLRDSIEYLAMERFARPLGLVTLERHVPDPERPWDESWIVRATPLAHEVVRFEV